MVSCEVINKRKEDTPNELKLYIFWWAQQANREWTAVRDLFHNDACLTEYLSFYKYLYYSREHKIIMRVFIFLKVLTDFSLG